jgi:hypothetical protein
MMDYVEFKDFQHKVMKITDDILCKRHDIIRIINEIKEKEKELSKLVRDSMKDEFDCKW